MDCEDNMFKNVFAKVLSASSAIDLGEVMFNKLWRLAEGSTGFL